MLNNELTEFKDIEGYEGIYQVSRHGYISNGRKPLKTYKINSGYQAVKLFDKDGVRKSVLLHRVVAQAFIPNPERKAEVNHINGIKTDNSVENLEWVTSSENKRHALDEGVKIYNVPTKGLKLSSKSKYHNVGWDNQRQKWNAGIRIAGKTYGQKRFNTEEDAALHVNKLLDELGLHDRPRNVIV